MIKNFNLSESNLSNFIDKVKSLDLKNVRYVASVVEKKSSRSIEQNSLMWAVLAEISNQIITGNKKYSAEVWHEYFKRDYLPESIESVIIPYDISDLVKNPLEYKKWDYLPCGERILKGSTTDLTTKGFSLYMEQIYAFASGEGVIFES